MRKRTNIEVAGRRQLGSWVDAVNPSPSQTISSSETNVSVFPGSGDTGYSYPCAGGNPTHRNPCGELGMDLGAGWKAPPQSGGWKFYPSTEWDYGVNASGHQIDPFHFQNAYLTGSFPYIEYIHDGAEVEYFPTGGHATILRSLSGWRVQAAQPGAGQPVHLQYFGGSYTGASAAMSGLSTYLSEWDPYEVLFKFHWFKIADAHRLNDTTTGSGVYFGFNDIRSDELYNPAAPSEGSQLDHFYENGAVLMNSNRVNIETLPYIGPGFPTSDYISVSVRGTNSVVAYINELPGCGGFTMQEGAEYYLRTRFDHLQGQTKLWLASEPEPEAWSASVTSLSTYDPQYSKPGFNVSFYLGNRSCDSGYQWDTPCLDFPDMSEGMSFSSLTINPTSPTAGTEGCVHPLDDFMRADSPEDDFRFATSSSGLEWDHRRDYTYIYLNKGEMTPENPVGSSEITGAYEALLLPEGTITAYPLDVRINFSTPNDAFDETLCPTCTSYIFDIIRLVMPIGNYPAGVDYHALDAFVQIGYTPSLPGIPERWNGYNVDSPNGQDQQVYDTSHHLDPDVTHELIWHIGYDSVTLSLDGSVVASTVGVPADAELPTELQIRSGAGTRTGSGAFYPLIDLTSVDILQAEVDCSPSDCDPTTNTGPGYYYDSLLKKSAYWIPASSNVSYIVSVYFDGIAVTEGVEYWLDGLKIYPTDPAIFADTIAAAEVVIQ